MLQKIKIQRQAVKLKEKGFEALVAYPKNWEVWIPADKTSLIKN